MTSDLNLISFADLALEPMEGEAAAPDKPKEAAAFHANTRGKTERRVSADRRQEFRFEPDRRTGKDRRPKTSWEPGSNL